MRDIDQRWWIGAARSRIQTYERHHSLKGSNYWLMCVFIFICGITALIVSACIEDGHWFVMGLGILFFAAGFSLIFQPLTIVDANAQLVRQQRRLFGHFLVVNRHYYFSDFTSIVVRRLRGSNIGRDPDQFFVYLRLHSGRQVLVSDFEADISGRCRPAEDLAQRLSVDLGVQIIKL